MRALPVGRVAPAALFSPPVPSPGLVPRTALMERIDAARGSCVVVSAPGGYGKTTLLAQWAARSREPLGWLHAHEAHDEPSILLRDLLGALGAAGVGDPVLGELASRFETRASARVLPRIGHAVMQARAPFTLVVDDAGILARPHQRETLEVLARNLPQEARLVLSSRGTPSVPLAGLRASRRLLEIGQGDLAMDAAEARGVLDGLGVAIGEAGLARLMERTEGWAAGIVLAGMAARRDPDHEAAIGRMSGGDREIADYFAEEVLRRTPAAQLTVLARTSVLDVLTPAGCSVVMGEPVTAVDLRRIAADNHFVVQVDAAGERFRHHHLFSEMLQAELVRREPQLVPVVHGRAARWWLEQHDPLRATRHLVAGGMDDEAARLVWRSVPLLQTSGRLATLREMIRAFPPEEVRRRAPLALASAWSCVDDRSHLVAHWTRIAAEAGHEGPLPGGPESVEAATALLDAVIGDDGVAGVARHAERAYDLDVDTSPWRSLAAFLRGCAAHLQGDAAGARAWLREAAERSGPALPSVFMLTETWEAVVRLLDGDWAAAAQRADRAQDTVDGARLDAYSSTGLLRAVQALLAAHDRDPVTARERIAHARVLLVPNSDVIPWWGLTSRILLARAAVQIGEHATAATMVSEAGDFHDRVPDSALLDAEYEGLRAAIEGLAGSGGTWVPGALTTAELRVLGFLPTHLTFREIGERLHLSRFTIKSQALAAYRKLGVTSRSEAVTRARALGLIDQRH